jgi:hypothetical protein
LTQNAQAELNKAAAESDVERRNAALLLSRQHVLYGKSGVQMSGSPIATMSESAALGELKAQQDLYAGQIAAGRDLSSASMESTKAKYLKKMAPWAAATTLLTGAAKGYMAYGTPASTSGPGPGYSYLPNPYTTAASGES